MEDQGIVELFFDRSEQAIVETDKKYGGYCYTIAYQILASREDSEESVSDTYFSAWNTIPPRKPTLLQAFLGKITRHISIDRWRKQSAQKRGGKEMILALEELGGVPGYPGNGGGNYPQGADPCSQRLLSQPVGNGAECVPVPVLVYGHD